MIDLRDFKVFQLPVNKWIPNRDIFVGLVLSSIIINVTALVLPLCLLQIYDRIIPNAALDTLNFLLLAVIIAIIIGTIMKIARAYVSAWADARLIYLSGINAFNHILKSDLTHYEKEGSGAHLERMNALESVKDFFGGQAISSIIDFPFVLLFLIAIAYIDVRLLAIPLFIQVVLGICIHISSRKLNARLRSRGVSIEKKLSFVVETLIGIHTVKALGMEPQLIRRYERLQETAAKEDYQLIIQNTKNIRLTTFAQQLNIILVITFGCFFVMENSLSIGGLTACILLSGRIIQPISAIIFLWGKLQVIVIAQNKFNSILQLPRECPVGLKQMISIEGKVTFENVSFRYRNNDSLLLKNANFVIPPKSITMILSDGIAGKSSVLGIIDGLNKIESGKVYFDDKDVSEYETASYRRFVGYLPQDGILFSGTILENLTLFDIPNYREQALSFSKFLGLEDIILQMPEGYQTVIGRTSDDIISKGVKQRILIIRSLIHNPKIILFDESNSALDNQSDKLLRDLLIKLKEDRTIVMITHRPSFAKIADQYLLIRDQKFERLTDEEYLQYMK